MKKPSKNSVQSSIHASREKELTRRGFMQRAAGVGAGVIGASVLASSCETESRANGAKFGVSKSAPALRVGARVVVARDPSIRHSGGLDADKVKRLLFRAIREFTGARTDRDAWQRFFDGSQRVSLKLNCIAGRRLSSTPELTSAINDGLALAGVRPGNILCWDRTERELRNAGFTPGRDRQGVWYLGTDSQRKKDSNSSFGYDRDLTIAGEVGSRVARIASVFSDAIINVPVLKDHDLAGVSGALKNYFGAIHNPNKLHENGCDPYVADLNLMPVFREKTRLIVCDATLAQYNGGPGYKPAFAWDFSGVIVGTDPVAVDTVIWKIIEDKRAAEGLPTLVDDARPPAYIASAAHPSRALGENRLNAIDEVWI